MEQREVAITTLDAISSKYSGRFGLKIDTEGFELDVLRGAKKTLKKCEFVILELSLTERFKGLAPPSSVIELLTKSGLEFRDVLDVSPPPHRHLKPHLMDILFTRWSSD